MKNTNETFFVHLRYDTNGVLQTNLPLRTGRISNLGGFTLAIKVVTTHAGDDFHLKCAWSEVKRYVKKNNNKKVYCNFDKRIGHKIAYNNLTSGKNVFFVFLNTPLSEANLHESMQQVIRCFLSTKKVKVLDKPDRAYSK